MRYVFFFQAEDGIRDKLVTGVQTCALPIWGGGDLLDGDRRRGGGGGRPQEEAGASQAAAEARGGIGRAAWRGRGEISVGAGSLKKKKKHIGTGITTGNLDNILGMKYRERPM